jgi:hypothetical protein
LPEEVERIFFKMKEQLEDSQHPLIRLVKEFHKHFIIYVKNETQNYDFELLKEKTMEIELRDFCEDAIN